MPSPSPSPDPSRLAYDRAYERIARVCAAGGEPRQLRVRLLRELRAVLGFDAFAFLLTDPVTEVGCAPVARVPDLAELPRIVRRKYLTPVNRWTGLSGAAALSGYAPGARGAMWAQALAPLGVRDLASVVFRDRHGCWGFLDLWRYGTRAAARYGDGTGGVAGPFGPAELGFLDRIAGPVTAALRAGQAAAFTVRPPGAVRPGPLVLLLSPGLRVRGRTPGSDAYLAGLLPPKAGEAPVPAAVYNVAAQLLAREAGVDPHPPRARVHLADGLWLTLRAARIGGEEEPVTGRAEDREIAVTIEESTPAERLDVFCRAYGLSARETGLLGLLAGALFLSEHTVQDHLKSVFAKTGTHSRRALLARALGT
ncbi:helix-turn-helix transcriptional regulator [Streptomyces sp. NPDC004267]|uniref:helix-turn-helix transcriptional regulator n=1 Tax=Streptomyces sp. NPDC004267 TaxID=3364694 RepID=UPI0036B55B85